MIPALHTLDYTIIRWASGITSSDSFLSTVVYFCAELLILAFPIVLLLLWENSKRGKFPRNKKAVVLALVAVSLTLAVKTVLSFAYFRDRPFVSHPDLPSLDFHVDAVSFPSGHTMLAFAMATSLFMSGYKKLGGVLLGTALIIGLARICAGVHYPSDILGGIIFGVGSAWYLHREASTIKNYLPDEE